MLLEPIKPSPCVKISEPPPCLEYYHGFLGGGNVIFMSHGLPMQWRKWRSFQPIDHHTITALLFLLPDATALTMCEN
jgi:hypothetical protein